MKNKLSLFYFKKIHSCNKNEESVQATILHIRNANNAIELQGF